VRLSVELPAETKDRPHRLVEMYDSRDDSIVQVYAWSLPATLQDDRRRLFWKEITPETWRGRGLAYFERSRRVFG
jgi:hypothetical protein